MCDCSPLWWQSTVEFLLCKVICKQALEVEQARQAALFLLLGQPVFDIEVCTAICQHTIWLKAVSPDCTLTVKPYMLKAQHSLYKRSKTPLMGVLLLLFFRRFFCVFISTWNCVRLPPSPPLLGTHAYTDLQHKTKPSITKRPWDADSCKYPAAIYFSKMRLEKL